MSMKIFNLVYYDVNQGKQGVYASFKNEADAYKALDYVNSKSDELYDDYGYNDFNIKKSDVYNSFDDFLKDE